MDKELADAHGEQLNALMEMGDTWCPLGPYWVQCCSLSVTQTMGFSAHSASLQAKPSWAVQLAALEDGMPEAPGQDQEVAPWEAHEFLHVAQDSPWYQYRQGQSDSEQLCQELGGGWKAACELQTCTPSPETKQCPGLHPEHHGQQGRERILPLCSDLVRSTWSTATALWPSAQERHGPAEASRLGPQKWWEGWNTSCMRKGWERDGVI